MKLIILLSVFIFNSKIQDGNRETLKLVTKDETIFLSLKDVENVDFENQVIMISADGVKAIKNIKGTISKAYLRDINDEWIPIGLIEARNAKREIKSNILLQNSEIFFYSANQIVFEGQDWSKILGNVSD
ncbi:MAG: hypothetical protein ACK4UK_03365 [Flavobacterium sp.]